MDSSALRARSVFEIIDASVQLLRQHYGSFVLVSLIAALPQMLTKWLSGWYAAAANPLMFFRAMGGGMSLLFVFLAAMWALVFQAALFIVASDAYLTGDAVPARALQRVARRVFALLFSDLAMALIVGLGFLLLIVPGVYFSLLFFAVLPVLTIENASVDEAFHRSRVLSQAAKGRIFGACALTFLILWLTVIGVAFLTQIAHPSPMLQGLFTDVVVALISPLFYIMITLLYYDQRIRKEGFDLEVMARQLGPAPSPAAS